MEAQSRLKSILDRSGLVGKVSPEVATTSNLLGNSRFTLSAIGDYNAFIQFLNLIKSTILIDLTPQLDECYALGPYTVFDRELGSRTSWGESLYKAKYLGDQNEPLEMLGWIEDFIGYHPSLKTVDSIVAAPKGDPNTPDLAGMWTGKVAVRRGWQQLTARKTQVATGPQKELDGTETEENLIDRVSHSVRVEGVNPESRVLILDDTIRSGGTLKEIARALREAGATEVYGLSIAKDAQFTQGGFGFLDKERWE